MICEIRQIDPDAREVFGFAAASITADESKNWYAGLLKSCATSGSCAVGQVELIEMACLDAEKLSKMDCASSVTGFWVGLRIGDPSIWNSVQRGAVTKFTIDVAAKGVEIEFPQPRASAPSLRKKGITKMCDTNELPESVSKALDSESSSREDFELALDDLTKALRKDTETFEAAYNRALMTPVGKRLYSGLDAVSS